MPYTTAAPAVLVAWIECAFCGRIDKAAHDFNYPADMAEDTEFFVWMAKLRMRRELKPAH